MTYRLGIDIGTNSLGWCVLDLSADEIPVAIRDIGVRIFPDGRDPQSGTSLAVDRRMARGMRRRRDRYLLRRGDLMKALIRHDLMPADEPARKQLEIVDPYELRARGLDEALTLHQLGRAIFHLGQRRGFRSNRKTDKADEKESGKIKQAASRLDQKMAESGARTLGEFFCRRRRKGKPVRVRLRGEGAKAEYDFYPQRAMLEAEFDLLWEAQAGHHPNQLTDKARKDLRRIIFRQRLLRPVEPGKCALDPASDKDDSGGFRAPWALPIAQRFRIYQELANLRIVQPDRTERPLTRPDRDAVANELLCKGKRTVTFKAMHRILRLERDEEFNLESEKRRDLQADETAAVLSKKGLFGPRWHDLDDGQQEEIVECLLSEKDEEALVAWLEKAWNLDAEAAAAVAAAHLPDGHARLGRRALAKIVPIIRDQGLVYADAAEEAGYHHSDRRPDDLLPALPYYGEALARHVSGTGDPDDPLEARFGRIANPTVHIGLNQLRKVVNALIEEHGQPAQIVVELVRELKLSREAKTRTQKEQAENQRRNDLRRAKLRDIGQPDTGENRMRLRLWEELDPDDTADRRCVYTGEQISINRLFSPEAEVDHILPFSKTLDNSAANRTVSMRFANRAKGDRPPFEAFGHSPTIDGYKYDWDEILGRVEGLAKNKRWRFAPDTMEKFERERSFLDRQLTDTAYLSRATREYLAHVCDPNQVRAIPGRLTAMLRRNWGLNPLLWDHNLKNRVDHRHHTIDAVVTALTDPGMLKRISTAAEASRKRLIDDMPDPWEGFREELREALDRIVVSYKPDHGAQGKLHEETAYGLVADPAREDGYNLVYRKPLMALNENEVERIRDRHLRERLRKYVYEAKGIGKTLKEALAVFARETGMRRVRLLKKEALVIALSGPDGTPYKAYIPRDNHYIDIFELPDGTWHGEAVTIFQANQPGFQPLGPRENAGARLMMRVQKGDLLRLDHNGAEQVMRVVRLNAKANRLYLAPHNETGDLQKRHNDPDDPFRWLLASYTKLRNCRARPVGVDVLGRVRDPGPPR